MIYCKQCSGTLLPQKAAELQSWVRWTHHAKGKTHCEECLKLDVAGFKRKKLPLTHIISIVIAQWSRLTITRRSSGL